MAEVQGPMMPCRDDVELLLRDLAHVSGALNEIMTAWRRGMPSRPDLQLRRLVRIQATPRKLAADIGSAAGDGPSPSPDPALPVTGRFTALTENITSARTMTCGPAVPSIADGRSRELLRAALHTAATELGDLMPHLVTASD